MPKPQFYALLIMTMIQSQLLVWAMKTGSFLMEILFVFILSNNIYKAYRIEKFAKKNGFFS
ncbi:MAG: DUF3272 family protein [Lactovum sp.]